MSYQTYTTDALVVGSEDRLTADRVVVLFTRDAGLLYARAAGVRKEQSKLRYGLQDFSRIRVSLVRGKQGWRIIGAEGMHNLYFSAEDRAVRAALLRMVKIVRRLVRGEEAHPFLFDTLLEGLSVLVSTDPEQLVRAERLLTIRLLAVLGYVAPHPAYSLLLDAHTLTDALAGVGEQDGEEQAVRRAIDAALAVSQL